MQCVSDFSLVFQCAVGWKLLWLLIHLCFLFTVELPHFPHCGRANNTNDILTLSKPTIHTSTAFKLYYISYYEYIKHCQRIYSTQSIQAIQSIVIYHHLQPLCQKLALCKLTIQNNSAKHHPEFLCIFLHLESFRNAMGTERQDPGQLCKRLSHGIRRVHRSM